VWRLRSANCYIRVTFYLLLLVPSPCAVYTERTMLKRRYLTFVFPVHKRCSVADIVEGGMRQSPVSVINLVQLSRNVTDQYCANPDCAAGFSADYRLPVHPRYPLNLFLTLQFEYVSIVVFPELQDTGHFLESQPNAQLHPTHERFHLTQPNRSSTLGSLKNYLIIGTCRTKTGYIYLCFVSQTGFTIKR